MGGHSFQEEEESHSVCQIYDIESNTWQEVVFDSNSIASFSAVVINIPRQYLNKMHLKQYMKWYRGPFY